MFTRLRQAVVRVANTSKQEVHLLPALERSLLPLLALSSCLYAYILALRWKLYHWKILRQTRLPLPVISIGNISWGGNGKTPMAEYLASKFLECSVPPLILTRGYGSGDEVRLLEDHLHGTRAIIGAGSNRVEVAKLLLFKYGVKGVHDLHSSIKHLSFNKNHKSPHDLSCMVIPKLAPHDGLQPHKRAFEYKREFKEHEDGMGVILLDDGMQHWRVRRDIEIVMINAVSPFGNGSLVPCGPLREPLQALCRTDVAVIHHANLSDQNFFAAPMASGEDQWNLSTSGDAGEDHNEDFDNEYGLSLPTQEELREMEHRKLIDDATNMMLNFAKDPNLAKYMTETVFQDVYAQWKATTTSP
ncbi:hypothetical protein L7F22_023249 [Adiantum nelumboides]|nr:hypothetical protein [Adiantum nelumboides]